MSIITFDTQKYADTLLAGGVPPDQVRAMVNAQRDALQFFDANTVNKADLSELKAQIVQWMIGLMLAHTGLIAGILFAILK